MLFPEIPAPINSPCLWPWRFLWRASTRPGQNSHPVPIYTSLAAPRLSISVPLAARSGMGRGEQPGLPSTFWEAQQVAKEPTHTRKHKHTLQSGAGGCSEKAAHAAAMLGHNGWLLLGPRRNGHDLPRADPLPSMIEGALVHGCYT